MAQQQAVQAKPIPLTTITTSAAIVLAFLAFGGYMLNWTWTGFTGNTLWDWLQLLVLPIVLTVVTVWISNGSEWRIELTIAAIIAVGMLAVFAIGGYFFNWQWTGFSGNTLWDWLKLLLLPLVLAVGTARFTQSQAAAKESAAGNPVKAASATKSRKHRGR